MAERLRVLSGMQRSGKRHLGNRPGALQRSAAMSTDSSLETLYRIVSAHPRDVAESTVNEVRAATDLTAAFR